MKKITFKENEAKDIINMYINFIPVKDICKKYDVCKTPIYNLLKENNISLHGEKQKLSEENIMEMIDLYLNGETQQSLADKYSVNRWTIKNELLKHGIQLKNRGENNRTYKVNEHYFDNITTEEQSYFLGLLWADGCNKTDRGCVSIKLQEKDKYILEKFREVLDSDHPIYFHPKQKDSHQNLYSLEINSRVLSNRLEELGMVANKSLVLEFPKWLNENLYPSFIRGILDGDGHISKNNFAIEIVGSKDVCYSIKNILHNIEIDSFIYDKTENTKVLFISKKNYAMKFLNWIYANSTIHLTRKYEIYENKYI